MSDLKPEIIDELSELSQIYCSEQEKAELLNDLKKIIHYVEQLKEVDTQGVKPCIHVSKTETVLRSDEESHSLSRSSFLKNCEEQVGGMVSMPAIIDKH